jgi:UDP-glucose:(glucosyl)LPS alpha-1,3-glucosyltransferase
MDNQFTTEYFEQAQLYTEKHEFLYKNPGDLRDVMHICHNINDPFFPPLGAEITSILETNPDISFSFYVFVDSYSEKNKINLEKTAKKYKCNIYLYVMDMSIYQNFHIKVKRFSRVTYIRIVMPWIMRKYTNHYLYLDSDMICVGSLRQFLTTDLEGTAIGALTYHTPDRVAFLKMKQDTYFSDGLMWIDVNEWIREKITEQVFSYQGADPHRFKGQTQDLINLVVEGHMKPIPALFHHKNKDFSVQGILIHYSGRDKPWEIVLDSDDELWRHYLDISFWDSMPNPMPPKTPEFYHSFKKLGQVYGKKGQTIKKLECYFWYAILKIRKKL